jgi:hypothetical protein
MDSSSICLSSDHRTVHVFNLSSYQNNSSFIDRYFKRNSNIRLYMTNLKESDGASNTQCAFISNGNSISVIDLNGSYYKFDVDLERLNCLKWTRSSFICAE